LYLGLILITFVHMIFPFLFFYIMSVDNVVISIGLTNDIVEKKIGASKQAGMAMGALSCHIMYPKLVKIVHQQFQFIFLVRSLLSSLSVKLCNKIIKL
jgi:hypothetical protein